MSKTPSEILKPFEDDFIRHNGGAVHPVTENIFRAKNQILDEMHAQLAAQGEQLARVTKFLTIYTELCARPDSCAREEVRQASQDFLTPPAKPEAPREASEWGPEVERAWQEVNGPTRWRLIGGVITCDSVPYNNWGSAQTTLAQLEAGRSDTGDPVTLIYTRPNTTAKGPSPSQPEAASLEQKAESNIYKRIVDDVLKAFGWTPTPNSPGHWTHPAWDDHHSVRSAMEKCTSTATSVLLAERVAAAESKADNLDKELLRVRTTGHGAAHELDNIAVECGLGHSPAAGAVAAYVRKLQQHSASLEARVKELEAEVAQFQVDQTELDRDCDKWNKKAMQERDRATAAERKADEMEADCMALTAKCAELVEAMERVIEAYDKFISRGDHAVYINEILPTKSALAALG